MRAMVLHELVSLDECDAPLVLEKLPKPAPRGGQVLVEVACCGVCHTELDEIEGRTPPAKLPMVLGHQVVGRVVEQGTGATKHPIGQRVGIGWIHSSNGRKDENLASEFHATGRDAPGGYAEYLTVPEDYAYPIPKVFTDAQAAPLLCAGGVGYRSLRLCKLVDGQRLGLTGFGASAHLVLQIARHLYPRSGIYVFARSAEQRAFAKQLGACWAGDTTDCAPQLLDAVIDTTPAWRPVVEALGNLRPGGRLIVNAIRKEASDQQALLDLDYTQHLWMEKEIKSVANVTHHDLAEFLPMAADVPLKPTVECLPLELANEALLRVKRGGGRGAQVLMVK